MGTKDVARWNIDTNVIVRYLLNDVVSQADEVEKLFEDAEKGKVEIVLSPVVVAETTFVLETYYHQTIEKISKEIQSILIQPWVTVEHEKAVFGLWKWYEQGQHFVDSYLLALEKYEGTGIFSFDKNLNKKRTVSDIEKKG